VSPPSTLCAILAAFDPPPLKRAILRFAIYDNASRFLCASPVLSTSLAGITRSLVPRTLALPLRDKNVCSPQRCGYDDLNRTLFEFFLPATSCVRTGEDRRWSVVESTWYRELILRTYILFLSSERYFSFFIVGRPSLPSFYIERANPPADVKKPYSFFR